MGKSRQRKWYDHGDGQDDEKFKEKAKARRNQKKTKYHMKTDVRDKYDTYDRLSDDD